MNKTVVPLIGRILLAQIFLVAGIEKIMGPANTQAYMASKGMPFTLFFLIAAICFELGGGLSLLLGLKARLGALALAFFLIPTTLIFHTNFSEGVQQVMFMKNIAIIGGLMMIAAYGPGRASLDEWANAARSAPMKQLGA